MKADARTFLKAGLLILAGWWVYEPAMHGDWIWDDASEVTQNTALRDGPGLGQIWRGEAGADYLPVKGSVQWLEWHLWGDAPSGYHAVNLALHLLSALLLWRLLGKLGASRGTAWLGGLLFALHPVAVESVAWVAELKNALSLPPLLISLCLWVDWEGRGRAASCKIRPNFTTGGPTPYCVSPRHVARPDPFCLSLLAFLIAALCKSSVLMTPFVLPLYVWWRRGRIGARDLLGAAPFFAISLVLGLVTVAFQRSRAIGTETVDLGFLQHAAAAGAAAVFYLCKAVAPLHLAPIYPFPEIGKPGAAQFLPWLALGAGFAWLWTARRGPARHALFGLGFFFLNLIPVLGFIPFYTMNISWVADRLAYVPLAGLAGLIAAGLGARIARRAAAWSLLAGVPALLALQSRGCAANYGDGETFYRHALAENPRAWVAHGDLGDLLLRLGRASESVAESEEALRIKPNFFEARINLGLALAQQGRLAEAIENLGEATRLRPGDARARANLGEILRSAGRTVEAITTLNEAVALDPSLPGAQLNLGLALADFGRPAEAIPHYEKALRLDPDSPETANDLGIALAESGRIDEAIARFKDALRMRPDYTDAHANLAEVLRAVGRDDEAEAQDAEARLKASGP